MITLTREARFSLSSVPSASKTNAVNSWADSFPTSLLSPFLCLRATLQGEPHPTTGYLCDIKLIDDRIAQVIRQLIEEGHTANPSLTENHLLSLIENRLPREFLPGVKLIQLQLKSSSYCCFTLDCENPHMVQYTEQFEFSAAHRLHCPNLTDDQNRTLFGKCNNPNGHGHNYVVEVTVSNPQEAWDFPHRLHLMNIVKETVIDRFDHKHLNEDTAEFREVNPTVENITQVIWNLLEKSLQPLDLVEVKVYETPKTWAQIKKHQE